MILVALLGAPASRISGVSLFWVVSVTLPNLSMLGTLLSLWIHQSDATARSWGSPAPCTSPSLALWLL